MAYFVLVCAIPWVTFPNSQSVIVCFCWIWELSHRENMKTRCTAGPTLHYRCAGTGASVYVWRHKAVT